MQPPPRPAFPFLVFKEKQPPIGFCTHILHIEENSESLRSWEWFFKKKSWQLPVGLWLGFSALTARDLGSIVGQGTKMPQASWCGREGEQKILRSLLYFMQAHPPAHKLGPVTSHPRAKGRHGSAPDPQKLHMLRDKEEENSRERLYSSCF